nr:reverse transcriptase domain-containing protein [Tanacetum cinerariifolium]
MLFHGHYCLPLGTGFCNALSLQRHDKSLILVAGSIFYTMEGFQYTWGGSISPKGFLPFILLLVVIIVAVFIVAITVILVVVVGEADEDNSAFRTFEIKRMATKRTSTSATPAMTQVAIRKLVSDSVAAALEAQAATMTNTDNTNRKTRQSGTPVARKCSYKEFTSCQPFNFKGTEGAIVLIRWFERTESVFFRSNYTKDCKVKFATGTQTNEALSGWNSFAQPIGKDEAYKILCIEGNVTASKPQTLEEAITINQRLMDQ